MKKLRKNQKKKTVEAYACGCGTPNDCGFACMGDFALMNINALRYLNGMYSAG